MSDDKSKNIQNKEKSESSNTQKEQESRGMITPVYSKAQEEDPYPPRSPKKNNGIPNQ